MGVLKDNPQGAAQVFLADFTYVNPVIGNGALLYVIKPVNQVGDGGLARARGPHKGQLLPRLGIKAYICLLYTSRCV